MLGRFFQKEIEGIDYGEIGDQLHIDTQLGDFFWKYGPRDEVAEGILLPINKVILGQHF